MAYGLRRKQKELHGLRIEYLGTKGTTVLKAYYKIFFQESVANDSVTTKVY